jgi:formylglycine-generating enzyme required for sulfatase activity
LEYDNFEIEVGSGAGLEYEVAVRSRAGEAREMMRFPYDKLALDSRLKDLQIALLRSGGQRRRVASQEEQAVQDFGLDLFNALIANEVRARYDISQNLAGQDDKGLRLILRIQDPALAALPWEFMYDSRKGEYVCLSRNTPIVRYPESPQPIQPLSVRPPLHILCMAVSPVDLNPLDIDREKQRLEEAMKRLSGLVTLTWLEGKTWSHLQEAMQGGPWHIFHFIGHGGFNERVDEGVITLADEGGRALELSARKLARLLDHRHLKLVLLNACEGGRASTVDIFSSTASILVRSGIPAVLAMQYEITDTAAIEFSRSFYRAVAQGLPLEGAVVEARKAISIAVNNTVEWGTPVLYLRSADGRLFNVNLRKEQVDSLYSEARAAMAREDWLAAQEKIKAVLDQDPGHEGAWNALRVAEDQQKLLQHYAEGQEAYKSARWQKAQASFQSAQVIDRNYKDVSNLLKTIERKISEEEAYTLYSEAVDDLEKENWEHAIKLLENAAALSPDNKKISDELIRARRLMGFAEVYAEGKVLFEAGKWPDALSRFDQLKAEVGEYKDIQALSNEATQRLVEEKEEATRREFEARQKKKEEQLRREELDRKKREAEEKKARGLAQDAARKRAAEREEKEGEAAAQQTAASPQQAQAKTPPDSPAVKTVEGPPPERVILPDDKPSSLVAAPASRNRRAMLIGLLALFALVVVAVVLMRRGERNDNLSSNANQTHTGQEANAPANNSNGAAAASSAQSVKPPAGMTPVPGGEFKMGRDGDPTGYESPPHKVTVKPFFIDIYEVTREEYKICVDKGKCPLPQGWVNKSYPAGTARYPVTGVTWDAANAYCANEGKRLPIEKEWEFAARGGVKEFRYPWGNDWRAGLANADNAAGGLVDVDKCKDESPFNAFCMVGNAWEWTASELTPYKLGQPLPSKPAGESRVIRGGSYESKPDVATTTFRFGYPVRGAVKGYDQTGFRCSKDTDR